MDNALVNDIDYYQVLDYLNIPTNIVLDVLKQLGTIINLKGNKLSRGIVLRIWDENTVMVICPNEVYFFSAELSCDTTLPSDTCIYLDYVFLQKLTRFFTNEFYIFKYGDKFYLRLTTGNLELLNVELLDTEKKKLDNKYNTETTTYKFRVGDIYNKLKTLYSITDFEIEANKRWINSKDGVVTFKSIMLMAKSDFGFINAKVDYKILNYLLYLCSVSNSVDTIEITALESNIIPKYVIKYNKTYMTSSYPMSSDSSKVLSLFEELPNFSVIDYQDLKYKLEYADSITYAKGMVTFVNKDGRLIGKIKLQNNSETEVEIPVLGELYLKAKEQIRVNFKTLLVALSALDSDLETYFGLKDGLLYLINSDISLAIITF